MALNIPSSSPGVNGETFVDGKTATVLYYWNTNTLAYEVATVPSGGSGGGGTTSNVVVDNFPSTQEVTQEKTAVRYDEPDETTAYLGKAVAGSSENSGVWQISKLTFTGDIISISWADGNTSFDNTWSNRAFLTYT